MAPVSVGNQMIQNIMRPAQRYHLSISCDGKSTTVVVLVAVPTVSNCKNSMRAPRRNPTARGSLPQACQHLLQRSDATDTMAKKGSGDRRASSLGAAVVFQQCPGSRLVEPDMP